MSFTFKILKILNLTKTLLPSVGIDSLKHVILIYSINYKTGSAGLTLIYKSNIKVFPDP